MSDIPSLIQKLQDKNPDKRYDACEELRVAASITAEAITALQVATGDANRDVADAARNALALHLTTSHETQSAVQDPPVAAPIVPLPMPAVPPNSPEYIFALERRLMVAEEEVRSLSLDIQIINQSNHDMSKLPITAIIRPSFLTRAFAIWGHALIAQLIISVPIYCVLSLLSQR